MRHKDVFGRFTAYMLGLASKSGNMGKFIEQQQSF